MKYGIEIEAENIREPFTVGMGTATTDGSLRNGGVEYVSVILDDVDMAKQWHSEVVARLVEEGADFSSRCGTHIHMDFRSSTVATRKKFLEKYLLVERYLVSLIPSRKRNNFCLPLLDYDGDIENIRRVLEGQHRYFEVLSKYSALNLKPLLSQGSIEFRMLPSLPTVDLFNEVIDTLEYIRNNTVSNVVKKFKVSRKDQLEVQAFMKVMFKKVDTSSMEFLDKHFPLPERKKPKATTGITEESLLSYLQGLAT